MIHAHAPAPALAHAPTRAGSLSPGNPSLIPPPCHEASANCHFYATMLVPDPLGSLSTSGFYPYFEALRHSVGVKSGGLVSLICLLSL